MQVHGHPEAATAASSALRPADPREVSERRQGRGPSTTEAASVATILAGVEIASTHEPANTESTSAR
jgi:hypothetical protein